MAALAFIEAGGLGPALLRPTGSRSQAIPPAPISRSARWSGGATKAGPLPLTATLFYGCYAPIFDTPSHARFGAGPYLLRTEMMRWYWSNFLGPHCGPRGSTSLRAALCAAGGPAAALSQCGRARSLLDDTTMLSSRLASAGVRHTLDIWPGVVHGFQRLARDLPVAREAIAAADGISPRPSSIELNQRADVQPGG